MELAEKLRGIESELKGLSKEEKEKKVKEILSSLSEEEIEELKKQQCIFCMISAGNVESFTVYEDDFVKAVLDINPANKGHVLLFPKEHYPLIVMMDDKLVAHLFRIANVLSKAVFDGVKAQGTSMYIANGPAAGQKTQHAIINIIPRFEGDGLNFAWDGKKLSNEEMKNTMNEIRGKITVRKEREEKKEAKVESVSRAGRRIP